MEGRANNFVEPIGKKYKTNEGYEVEILKFPHNQNCTIRFNDEQRTIISGVSHSAIKGGRVKNPNNISVFGKGFLGVDADNKEYKKRIPKSYATWSSMIKRSYDEKFHIRQPTYKDSTIAEEWLNFQNYGKWFEGVYNPETMKKWSLDKDIISKGNKTYSPETCVLVPIEINNLFTKRQNCRGEYPIGVAKRRIGKKFTAQMSTPYKSTPYIGDYETPEEAFYAYKKEKEQHIKIIADKWKELIDPRVYKAMYKYEVEITD